MDRELRRWQRGTGAGARRGAVDVPAARRKHFRVGEVVKIVGGREAGHTGVVTYVDPTRSRRYRVKVYASLYAYCEEDEVVPLAAYQEPM